MKKNVTIFLFLLSTSLSINAFAQQNTVSQILKPSPMHSVAAPIPFLSPKKFLNLHGKNMIQSLDSEQLYYYNIDPNDNTTYIYMRLPDHFADGTGIYALGERFTGVKVKNYTVDSFTVTIGAHSFGNNPKDRLLFTLRKRLLPSPPNIFPAFTFVDSTQLLPAAIPSNDTAQTFTLHFDKKVKTKFTTSTPDFWIFAELPIQDTTGNSLFMLADATTDDPANHNTTPRPDGDRAYEYFSRNDSTFVSFLGGQYQRTSDMAIFYNQMAITAYISGTSLGVDDSKLSGNMLAQNYPNPFNPSTVISYSLEKASKVSIKLYNALGLEVATILDANQPAGENQVSFSADNLPSGTYFYTMKAGTFTQTKRMVLAK